MRLTPTSLKATHRDEWKGFAIMILLVGFVGFAPILLALTTGTSILSISTLAPLFVWTLNFVLFGYPTMLMGFLFFTKSSMSKPVPHDTLRKIAWRKNMAGQTTFLIVPLMPKTIEASLQNVSQKATFETQEEKEWLITALLNNDSLWSLLWVQPPDVLTIPAPSAHDVMQAHSQPDLVDYTPSFPIRIGKYLPKGQFHTRFTEIFA